MPCWLMDGRTALLAIVDTGPLLATANDADPHHGVCVNVLTQRNLALLIPALCVAEVCYFLGERHGADVEARFVAGLADIARRSNIRHARSVLRERRSHAV